jgi:protein TonB
LPVEPVARSPRIVDLVFAGEPAGRRRRLGLGVAVVLALYAGVFAFVSRLGSSLGPWGAEMAARVHDAIAVERAVDVTPPRPPPPSPVPSPAESPHVAAPRTAQAIRAPRARPAPPAQAGQPAAASPEPVDFTGSAFIVGSGASNAGGATTSTGTSRKPAFGTAAPGEIAGATVAARNHARPVSLDQAAWNCPWPAEADAQQVDEQTVVLRASVRADGRADHVDVLSDPGFGFGSAARLCALGTHFEPARDAAGQPMAAESPPVRVHFFR